MLLFSLLLVLILSVLVLRCLCVCLSVCLAYPSHRMAIQINPTFADGFSNMGNVYKDMGRFEEASELYLRAIGTPPPAKFYVVMYLCSFCLMIVVLCVF